ncbi:MAG: S41 family peptidase [Oscillospiraceae bacterium]|nr:S41 family peptidase [Oscillospiraceae bacterium]
MRKLYYILILPVVIAASVAATLLISGQLGFSSGDPVGDKVAQADEIISTVFVGDYDETAVGDAAVEGIVDALGDRWSYYISAADYAAYASKMTNSYVGIGVVVEQDVDAQTITVKSVTTGSPADGVGILPGDQLISVGGKQVKELGLGAAINAVRGEAGTAVDLVFVRDGVQMPCTVTRESVQNVIATAQLLDGAVGYITIANFDENCADQTIAAIDQMIAAGAKSLVFDVRFNPGGLQTELVKVLDYLAEDGKTLFVSEYYTGDRYTDYAKDGHSVDLPMAVLVNGDSYSAAEFFAAALQQLDLAEIVGDKTCGKGYFQITYSLDDGSAIAISSGKYYTPDGSSLVDVGITPDVVVTLEDADASARYYNALPVDKDAQLQAALARLQPK